LAALGFQHATGDAGRGQPPYDPADLLKLYLYGYTNRIRSSRRLELECTRNLELIWLLSGLRPGYHTIADFRGDNAEALKAVHRDFIALCRELELIGGSRIGIDGSFFNGNASAAGVNRLARFTAQAEALGAEIEAYQAELAVNDAAEAEAGEPPRLDAEQLLALKAKLAETQVQLQAVQEQQASRCARIDPDARCLRKDGKAVTGYNVQTAVDDQHKLILDAELTNARNDLGQLVPMIERSRAALGLSPPEAAAAPAESQATAPCAAHADTEAPSAAAGASDAAAHPAAAAPHDAHRQPCSDAIGQPEQSSDAAASPPAGPVFLADAGYYTEADIAACQAQEIIVYVPIPKKASSAKADGRFGGDAFHYDAEADVYHCPGACCLPRKGQPQRKNGNLRQAYRSRAKDCRGCALREQCLPEKSQTRVVYRSEHADAAERHRTHMDSETAQAQMPHRGGLCEHPFGTLKRRAGWDHFLVRGLRKAGGELALLIHGYNFTRVLNILGVRGFIERCRQLRAAATADGGHKRCVFAPSGHRPQTLWQAICAFAALPPINTTCPDGALSAR
jgi:hypothetical protein